MRCHAAIALALILGAFGAEAAAVKVVFTATSNQFSTQPFPAGSKVAGEFILDLDAAPLAAPGCPTGSLCLSGAVHDVHLSVDDMAFTADDVDVQLTPLSGGVLLSVSARAGESSGGVSGDVTGTPLTLIAAEFEARFPSSFYPQGLAELDLQQDFTLLVARLVFAPKGASTPRTTFTLEQNDFTSLVVSNVPLPAAGGLLVLPLAALVRLARHPARRRPNVA